MKSSKKLIIGLIAAGSLFTALPAHAAWQRDWHREWRPGYSGYGYEGRYYSREQLDDRRELWRDRQELRRDLRRGASPDEIARDRAEIRRDERELYSDRNWDWRPWYSRWWNR
jgi:hypothetical protein